MSVPKASDSLWLSFLEGSRFFMGQGPVHDTLRALAKRFDEEGIEYALIEGMALVAHGYRRFTEDIDVLVTADDLERFRDRCGISPIEGSLGRSGPDPHFGLPLELAERLDASVRDEYRRLWGTVGDDGPGGASG